MSTPYFEKVICTNGLISLQICQDSEVICTFDLNDKYIDFSQPLTQDQILAVISKAFESGFEAALHEATHSIKNIKTYYPARRIRKITDYKKINAGGDHE